MSEEREAMYFSGSIYLRIPGPEARKFAKAKREHMQLPLGDIWTKWDGRDVWIKGLKVYEFAGKIDGYSGGVYDWVSRLDYGG